MQNAFGFFDLKNQYEIKSSYLQGAELYRSVSQLYRGPDFLEKHPDFSSHVKLKNQGREAVFNLPSGDKISLKIGHKTLVCQNGVLCFLKYELSSFFIGGTPKAVFLSVNDTKTPQTVAKAEKKLFLPSGKLKSEYDKKRNDALKGIFCSTVLGVGVAAAMISATEGVRDDELVVGLAGLGGLLLGKSLIENGYEYYHLRQFFGTPVAHTRL